jgi:hypothetical protein
MPRCGVPARAERAESKASLGVFHCAAERGAGHRSAMSLPKTVFSVMFVGVGDGHFYLARAVPPRPANLVFQKATPRFPPRAFSFLQNAVQPRMDTDAGMDEWIDG